MLALVSLLSAKRSPKGPTHNILLYSFIKLSLVLTGKSHQQASVVRPVVSADGKCTTAGAEAGKELRATNLVNISDTLARMREVKRHNYC